MPSGTSPEEAGLVSVLFFWVLGSFFLLPKYNIKIKKTLKMMICIKESLLKQGPSCVFEVFFP